MLIARTDQPTGQYCMSTLEDVRRGAALGMSRGDEAIPRLESSVTAAKMTVVQVRLRSESISPIHRLPSELFLVFRISSGRDVLTSTLLAPRTSAGYGVR